MGLLATRLAAVVIEWTKSRNRRQIVMSEPVWIVEARKHIGVAEIAGPRHNSRITGWLDGLRAWWKDDETPWCGVYVAHCIKSAGLPLPKYWMRAKDWLNWGVSIPAPVPGCVVVFDREGGGHVGFVIGKDKAGNLMVLGGNQRNAVNVAPFALSRNPRYRWPAGVKLPGALAMVLPVLASNGQLSKNEA